ncbi:MAG TPA: heavy metal translocating P-type ATPase [Ignavibacteria bacterium]|jgi:Cu+-exporting ATPase
MDKTDKICDTIELDVEGMDCPSCALRIEKNLSKINGIDDIKVNLGAETAVITYENSKLDMESIKKAFEKIGYKAIEQDFDEDEEKADQQRKLTLWKFKQKIIVSIALSVIIVFLGMKEHVEFLNFLPTEVSNWVSLILSTVVIFWCGQKFLKGFWASLKAKTADMDTLIVLGTMSAYIYSIVIMLMPSVSGEHHPMVYFESAAMIITFILLGNYLEATLKSKTQYAVKSLTNLQSKNATVIRNDEEVQIPIKKVKIKDVVIVKPGERIPVDGEIIEGLSAVDESMITGESIPAEKIKGTKVIGGTMNLNGFLKINAEKVGKDSFLAKIIDLVKDAQKSKPKLQRIADRVSAVFVPVVVLIAIITFFTWYLMIGEPFSYSLLKAVAVLIIACPCALGLATPIAVVLGVGKAAENHILFNNAEAIENVNKIDTILFDKTGTVTYANFEVSDAIATNGVSQGEMVKIAASIEHFSEHPIAKAIVNYHNTTPNGGLYKLDSFKITSGIGVEARLNDKVYRIGGANLISKEKMPKPNTEDLKHIYVFEENKLIGEIRVTDKVKENAKDVIGKLKSEGYHLALISGDGKTETERVAGQLGIEDYKAQVLPDQKQLIVESYQQRGNKVAMIGDGINDAPSLTKADLGIAIGTGQDIAIESADVILVKGDLENLFALFKISKKTIRIIKQNIFWAFFYNAAAIPVAAGVLAPWGIIISPVVASMFMALSDVITVLGNSLRIKKIKC